RIIDMPTLKPLNKEIIITAARETGAIITVEDHQINGGLGSAVAEVLVENFPVPLKRVAINDRFTESGEYRELLEKYNLSPAYIVKESLELLKRKK
ncbi:MAG: transketolase family protein, partial [Actinobacteria bacterium]|nr:transketolase family protein [Actinomycetota bacterium]